MCKKNQREAEKWSEAERREAEILAEQRRRIEEARTRMETENRQLNLALEKVKKRKNEKN